MDRNQYLALSHAPMMDDNSSEDHTTDRVDVLPDSRSDNRQVHPRFQYSAYAHLLNHYSV